MSTTVARVIRNTGYLYVRMGITMFISLYTTRIILQALGASDFGVFNIVGCTIAMLGFLNISMASATQRFMSYTEGSGNYEKKTVIFNVSILLHFIVAIVAGIALIINGYIFFNGILNIPMERAHAAQIVYGGLVASTMFTVMTVPYDAVLNSRENMRYYAFVGILESVLKLFVAFACVYASHDRLIVYGVLMACIPFITLSIMLLYCHKHYAECTLSIQHYFDRDTMKEMASFFGWNLLNTMIVIISIQGQSVLLNHFFGTLLNAAQGITTQLNGQLQALSSGMTKALNPVIGKSAGAHDGNLFLKSVIYGSKFSSALFSIIAIPVFLEAPYILKIWLKEVPEWTVVFIRFQLLKTFVDILCVTVPRAIEATGRIRRFKILSSFTNIIQLPLIYIVFHMGFQPYFMYIIALLFGAIMTYSIALYCARTDCNIPARYFILKAILPVSASVLLTLVIAYPCMMAIAVNSISSLVFSVTLTMLIFAVSFYCICCQKEERRILYSLFILIKTNKKES